MVRLLFQWMASTVLGKHTRDVASPAEEALRLERDFAIIQDQPMEENIAQALLVKVSLATLISAQVKAYSLNRFSFKGQVRGL